MPLMHLFHGEKKIEIGRACLSLMYLGFGPAILAKFSIFYCILVQWKGKKLKG